MFLMIPPALGEDVLDDDQNTGLDAAIEPQTRTSRATHPAIALTALVVCPYLTAL